MEVQRTKILDATIRLCNEKGIKFTMQQLAQELKMSKKTLYVWFNNKKDLFDTAVDYVFDAVQERKREIYEDPDLDFMTRLRRYLGTMPDRYLHINIHLLNDLKDKYPEVYDHVARRLESDWEATISLLEEGIRTGVLHPFSIPVFKLMMESSLEQFFQRDILIENNLTYQEALADVVDILLDGVVSRE